MRVPFIVAILTALGGSLVSCSQCAVRGTVLDITGTTVPGVAVTVVGDDAEDLTDGLGCYELNAPPKKLEVHFAKTGYTSGVLEIDASGRQDVAACPVTLWCLPQDAGAYLLQDFQFRSLGSVEPEAYATSDKAYLFGCTPPVDVEKTVAIQPILMFYRMPSYDLGLRRLSVVQAKTLDSPSVDKKVAAPVADIPVQIVPIDEPDRLLWEVRVLQPLEPGLYAVHWGAFEGKKQTESRAFLFKVVDPNRPAEETPLEEPEDANKEKKPADTAPILAPDGNTPENTGDGF